MASSLLKRFENNRIFTEPEAWALFKLAAYIEAFGWTLLGSSVLFGNHIVSGNVTVLVAGRVHGVLFMIYALSAIGLYPALGWSRKKALVALMASVPPYGTLVFEQWAKYTRQHRQFKYFSRPILMTVIANQD